VKFTGRLSHEKTMMMIAQSHVVVLPSLCLENCPMSLIEALAGGANVLTCNLGGMKEIVEASGVGFTFNPGDLSSLQTALNDITQSHAQGTLNAFDASAFLADRREDAYLRGLMAVYQAS
jgi:glycosyltransferase involved in cell wall biosynthesis